MHMRSQRSEPDSSPAENRPIELMTENGYSILRSWEIERVKPPENGEYSFMVRSPLGTGREIGVGVTSEVVVEIANRTRGRILLFSTFWIYCSERHLAIYLWEKNDYPPGDKLLVKELDPEDCLLALRWETT
ncbi:MAG: hypothetical protein QOH71_4379 [Blastocatellia bacterium]|nr:hypothetical protein [Blastocatellia bacterium]